MIRSRVTKLERMVRERAANCPGCLRIPALVLAPQVTGITKDPPSEYDTSARCQVCGKVHERLVIQIVTPGMNTPLVPLD